MSDMFTYFSLDQLIKLSNTTATQQLQQSQLNKTLQNPEIPRGCSQLPTSLALLGSGDSWSGAPIREQTSCWCWVPSRSPSLVSCSLGQRSQMLVLILLSWKPVSLLLLFQSAGTTEATGLGLGSGSWLFLGVSS